MLVEIVGKNKSLHISSCCLTLSWTQTGLDFDREIQNAKREETRNTSNNEPAHWSLINQDN